MDAIINLPGYDLGDKIGEGGMATVWMARQIALDRTVAVKILSTHLVDDSDAIQKFRQEAQAAARLKHPGIVQVYDAGESDGLLYFVMEFVAGCTVSELLEKRGRLTERNALLIVEGVATALRYAWDEARLVHCDIKPSNIMIDQDGSVKVADLGLARLTGMTGVKADEAMIEGTPHDTSPEQARGESDLDCRADIYSLGAMLYHLLTGRVPFGDRSGTAALECQGSGFLPDPQDVNHELTLGVAWLGEKMMVKDRTIRIATWAELLTDIEAVKHGEMPPGKPPSAGQSTILRSELRSYSKPPSKVEELELQPEAAPHKPKTKAKIKAKDTEAGARQKIVLSKELRAKSSRSFAHRPSEMSRAFYSLVVMLVAVLMAYGALSFFRYARDHKSKSDSTYWEQVVPPRSQIELAAKPSETASGKKVVYRVQANGNAAKPASPGQTIKWQNPSFRRGAQLFNDALEKYKAYSTTKQNPQVLPVVEKQCRDAIKEFESIRKVAPPEVNIGRLVDQCYGLIANVRQSTLLVSSSGAPSSRSEPVKPSTVGVPPSAMAAPGSDKKDLVLATSWNAPQRGGEIVLEDLRGLLADRGQADVDLVADKTLMLYGPIYYLMPISEAARTLGQSLSPKKSVSCPGFPKDSFFAHAVEGDFGEGFKTLLLVTDSTDRIVAVQLVDEHPDKSLWLDPQVFSDKWHVYNFVQLRSKGSAKWKIGQRVETIGRTVRIDSELVANDEFGYFGLGDSQERVQLYLPPPIVNLILFRIEALKRI